MVGMLKIRLETRVLLTKYEHLSILIAGMSAGIWKQMEKRQAPIVTILEDFVRLALSLSVGKFDRPEAAFLLHCILKLKGCFYHGIL